MESDLFENHVFSGQASSQTFRQLEAPLWTENKARLISRYLRYFVFITQHGTYLDLFAGPQEPDHHDSWAAKLVIESLPKRLRHFALFELDKKKIPALEALIAGQPARPKRDICLYQGDMNVNVVEHLTRFPIRAKEATFCLLDQHTFECDWSTVEFLARHKQGGHKIELFYFLAQGWIDRAVAGLKREPETKLRKWWGNDDWKIFFKKPRQERGTILADRFKSELGYEYAYAFPIHEKAEGGKVMFYMVHASDHPEAGKQMFRAYNNAIRPLESDEQLALEFNGIGLDA
jgi:three-Cys-motif partner protein